jgi:hypothetical protein
MTLSCSLAPFAVGTPLQTPDRLNLDRIGAKKKGGQHGYEQKRNDPDNVRNAGAPRVFCVWQHRSIPC